METTIFNPDASGDEPGNEEVGSREVDVFNGATVADSQGLIAIAQQLIAVKVISRTTQTALVEWVEDGNYHRSFVPTAEVIDGHVERPHWGAPYGEDWAALITEQVDLDAIANELRRRGIWTVDDLQANSEAAKSVIQAAASRLLSSLLGNAKALTNTKRK